MASSATVIQPRVALLFTFVAALSIQAAPPRTSPDGLWGAISENAIPALSGAQRFIVPNAYRTVTLDVAGFQTFAANAPMEFTNVASRPVMTLPMPDGSFARFAIEESPVMEPELAAQVPDIKTYRAYGLDDPTATARLDVTQFGFHGLILSAGGAVYIDPYRSGDTAHYITYFRRDYVQRTVGIEPFHCDIGDTENASHTVNSASKLLATAHAPNGSTLRTYRLALAADGEYTQFYGGTISGALAGMTTTMNRVNEVYETEVAVHMNMVANTSLLIYTNPTSDPYKNTSADLAANQATIDSVIGSANYDIGHLFGTGGGGVAQLGVVCRTNVKARGLTGSSAPVGDAYDIDYVAHEMGHQFGANHTFNGTTSNCGGGNRAASKAYEPGSGSTIMAYAGICGAENLQQHSDPYFHVASYDEILNYISNTATCSVNTATGDNPPNTPNGMTTTVPANTPFYLTSGGTDPDGDALTFCWEEFDLGSAAPPNTDNGTRPIFRSFNPTTSPVRTFPQLSDILNNVSTLGESLPTTTRTMNFRVTVRDGRGGVTYNTAQVSVTNAAGPFQVTAPNTAVSWAGNSTQTVTWNVANTTAAPVSCANVMVLLSTDGGNTFPTTLLASTPNDGSEAISVPNVATSTGRVRVECVGRPFFDISNANFSITAVVTINVTATATTSTNVAVSWSSISGAVRYDVYRKAAGGDFTLVGSSVSTSYNDTTATPATAYLYAVRSVDAGNVSSPLSAPDLATTVIFTDPTLVAGTTIVKAVHVTELRTAVNAVRALAGLPAASFTTPSLGAGASILAAHVTELRTALDAARSALSLPAVSYRDPTLVAGDLVRAADVEELRNGVR
ncbi:MAG: hypothetical protein JOZ54_25530 [Acidobacteria bacterium]|nr:hypothetical protein [Acidobacteriota bacterium]